MAYKVLITSLYEIEKGEPIHYFYHKDGSRNFFCDAFMTVEASTKYILSNYDIDEILTIGRTPTFDEGDDGIQIKLREGKTFYSSNMWDLSTYSLFRYRIAQFIDELKIEQQDIEELLDPEERKKAVALVDDLYRRYNQDGEKTRFNRMFKEIANEKEIYGELKKAVTEIIDTPDDFPRWLSWIKAYLYENLKDSCKMEILKENEDVMVRFIPTDLPEDGKLPLDNILEIDGVIPDDTDVEIYAALNNDDITDNYVIMSLLDIIDSMYGDQVTIKKVITTTFEHNALAGEIRDDTPGFGITELVSAMDSFLRYGKVDMLVDYWRKSGAKNSRIEKMIYAMRHIDAGLSLCNISEIENGIEQLRMVFSNSQDEEADDYYSRLFEFISDGIKRDYGSLLEGDSINFIELVKWAYRKKFYQQTLTVIESKAPEVFVDKGIFYYCDSEESKEHVIMLLAEKRAEYKPYEYWKMDDLSHYFIKHYVNKPQSRGEDPNRVYALSTMRLLDNTDEGIITAHTCCEDRQALEELFYAYYNIGNIRNKTNHADEEGNDDSRLIKEEDDLSYRMLKITEAIEYFLRCYDRVAELVKDKHPNVIHIPPYVVKGVAKKMEKH